MIRDYFTDRKIEWTNNRTWIGIVLLALVAIFFNVFAYMLLFLLIATMFFSKMNLVKQEDILLPFSQMERRKRVLLQVVLDSFFIAIPFFIGGMIMAGWDEPLPICSVAFYAGITFLSIFVQMVQDTQDRIILKSSALDRVRDAIMGKHRPKRIKDYFHEFLNFLCGLVLLTNIGGQFVTYFFKDVWVYSPELARNLAWILCFCIVVEVYDIKRTLEGENEY